MVFLKNGDSMKDEILRKQLESRMERVKSDTIEIKELAYCIWEKENGSLMEGIPVRSFGHKRVLRALGYVA
jgi:hypothetical protein